eukprot:gb/GECH01000413.1/.p1 GENE.gb/GECH01000413.1/~~gb/GECH01000413.1/.p1  ORF type:complete len:255 (+),score=49.58 gb/GECH01000413.1/:1-765(+)
MSQLKKRSEISNVNAEQQEDDENIEPMDEEDQAKLIQKMESDNQKYNRIYRILFCIIALCFGFLYLLFSISGEEFGEALGRSRSSFVHFVTSLALFICAYRAIHGRRIAYLDDDASSIASSLSFNSAGALNGSTSSPSNHRSPYSDMSSGSAAASPNSSSISRFSVSTILGDENVDDSNSAFYLAFFCTLLPLCLNIVPLYESYLIGSFNFQLGMFTAAPILYVTGMEYSLKLIQNGEYEIHNLWNFTYHYKQL